MDARFADDDGVSVTLRAASGVSTPRLENLMNGDLAAWTAKRSPIPVLDRVIKQAERSAKHFQLELKNGNATTVIVGWARRRGETLTLCIDGASVDKPTPLAEQFREIWSRGVMRKVSDPAFGRFVGVAINAIRERLAADPTIKKVEIVGTQIASPHLANMLGELGFKVDMFSGTLPSNMSWGMAASGLGIAGAQLLAQPTAAGMTAALAVAASGVFAAFKTSSMRGVYVVDRTG